MVAASNTNQKIGWVNGLLILLLVVLPTVFGWFSKTAEMGILIAACSIALCFANLSKIQSFKGAGFEAQMREAVQEAYATLEKLQELVRPVARANIANIAYNGRWDGIDRETEHQLMTELATLLTSLELQDDPEIVKMMDDFYGLHANDHIRFLLQVMKQAHIENENVQRSLTSLLKARLTGDYTPPSATIIRSAVAELSFEQRAILEPFIIDYEHYVMTHTYRRVEADSADHLPQFQRPGPQ
jgi:DnaJ-domain-containing protein 1